MIATLLKDTIAAVCSLALAASVAALTWMVVS